MLSFGRPFTSLLLDGNVYTNFIEKWASSQEEEVVQIFDRQTGPQQIIIQNSAFEGTQSLQPFESRVSSLSESWSTQQGVSSDLPASFVFTFSNYDSSSAAVHLRNLTIKELDFARSNSANGVGSFLNIMNSNVTVEQVKVQNLTTLTSGPFAQVLHSPESQAQIKISDSSFATCIAFDGGVLQLNTSQRVDIVSSNFTDNFAF